MSRNAGRIDESSAFSRVAPEAGLLLGAGRAILMQLAHPQIGTAIARHSDFASDPLKRLVHTLGYIYALSNGNAEQQRTMINYVNKSHQNVRGTRNESEALPGYSALDPRLQLWVAATLFDSARVIAEQILSGDFAHDEQLYQQYALLGGALQMPENYWPASLHDFDLYLEQTLATVAVTGQARQLADELFSAPRAPWWIRAGLPLMRDVTIAQLPAAVREQFGFELSNKVRRRNSMTVAFVRLATRWLPRAIRHLPMRLMLRHVDRM
ncbi:oxygenase MpaB family protein [Glutamicibacter sp. TV12E]|uniref:oxygenase MpaB family protein n=1 Tax=Glutamicibacter sp. TV12E TaxID=3446362 RepID=UPI004033187F